MPGQELERRRREQIPARVPAALVALGVEIKEDADGYRGILISDGLRREVNVLLPTSEIAQADPNFSPSINLVKLDPRKDGQHFYTNASWKGRLALRKEGLLTLAKTAGVLDIQIQRVPRDELDEGEMLARRATITIRRSDGTLRRITAEKGWRGDVERSRIEAETGRARQQSVGKEWEWSQAKYEQELEKRWLAEREHSAAKTETKAVLRAIRAALDLPQQFAPEDAAKPFLVVGFNFTPDYSDPEIKRMLVETGIGAHAQMYGGEQRLLEPSTSWMDEEPAETIPITEPLPEPQEPETPEEPEPEEPIGSTAGVTFDGPEPGVEPDPEPEHQSASPTIPERVQQAGELLIEFGKKHRNQTIEQIYSKDPGYVAWIARDVDHVGIRRAATAYLDHFGWPNQ